MGAASVLPLFVHLMLMLCSMCQKVISNSLNMIVLRVQTHLQRYYKFLKDKEKFFFFLISAH